MDKKSAPKNSNLQSNREKGDGHDYSFKLMQLCKDNWGLL